MIQKQYLKYNVGKQVIEGMPDQKNKDTLTTDDRKGQMNIPRKFYSFSITIKKAFPVVATDLTSKKGHSKQFFKSG